MSILIIVVLVTYAALLVIYPYDFGTQTLVSNTTTSTTVSNSSDPTGGGVTWEEAGTLEEHITYMEKSSIPEEEHWIGLGGLYFALCTSVPFDPGYYWIFFEVFENNSKVKTQTFI